MALSIGDADATNQKTQNAKEGRWYLAAPVSVGSLMDSWATGGISKTLSRLK